MTVTTAQNTHLGRAYLVEQCSCPVGYTGPSCEVSALKIIELTDNKILRVEEQLC